MAAAEKDRSRTPPRGARFGCLMREGASKTGSASKTVFYVGRSVRPSLRDGGGCHAGVKSFGDNVCCDGRASGSGVASADAPFAAPVPCHPRYWLRYSYSILAPACARWPIATAACDPTVHASRCRSQNDCTSVTVAVAADMASIALTLSFGVG